MWSKMLLVSLNIYILLSIVDGSKIIFLDTVIKKNPINETLPMSENGTMNEIGLMSSMFLEKITNETRPMNSILLDKMTNETNAPTNKPMHINTIMNETLNMNETKTMNETKPMNETIHQLVQNSTSKADVNYFISNFIILYLLLIKLQNFRH